jgi:hypothetical protein
MIYRLKIVFGKEQVNKFLTNEIFTDDELDINIKEYVFNSIEERESFVSGITEAVGWTDFVIAETVAEFTS